MASTPEGQIQTKIIKLLEKEGVFHWRQNNTPQYDDKLRKYRAFRGMRGVPDILAIIRGRFIGIEVKAPRGKQSPEQLIFQRRCEQNGGLYILARDVKTVDKLLKKLID
jgi:hypothetical protein